MAAFVMKLGHANIRIATANVTHNDAAPDLLLIAR
jgi:hypothetical protein